MAQLAIAAAGAIAGNALGWGIASLGLSGAAVGWTVGSLLGSALIKQPNQQGPRLGDLRVSGTEYGQPIPYIQAKPRVSGQIVYASDKEPVPNTQKVGKGGGQKVTTYTYKVDLLILLSENPINGVSRVWSNGDLIFSGVVTKDGIWDDFRVYLGTDTQLPDPTYEAAVIDAPAYRGRGYVFIQGLQLGSSGQIPNLTFELSSATVVIDDRIRLLTSFGDGTSEDQSNYEIGPGTQVNGSFTGGAFRCDWNTAAINRLEWIDAGLGGVVNAPVTYEALFQVVRNNSNSLISLIRFKKGSIGSSQNVFRLSISAGTVGGQISAVEEGIGLGNSSPIAYFDSRNPLEMGVIHVALIVFSDDTASLYLQGQRIHNRVSFDSASVQDQGYVVFGDNQGATRDAIVDFHAVRVTRAEVYTGATYEIPVDLTGNLVDTNVDIAGGSIRLKDVADNLFIRAGYVEGQYDSSGLDSDERVRGMAVGQLSNTRSVLEQLQTAYAFVVSKTNKVSLRQRQSTPVFTIPYAKLNARPEFQSNDGALTFEKLNDLGIPGQVAVSFNNMLSDYLVATEYSDRLRSTQVSTQEVQIPLGLLPEEGKRAADRLLFDLVSGAVKTTIKLPLQYAAIEPSDIFDVVDEDGQTYRLRCEQKTDTLPMLELQCVLDDVGVLDVSAITDNGYETSVLRQLAQTGWVSLDIPLLRDEDDGPGWYAAVYPVLADPTDEWPGGVYVKSTDNITYEQVSIIGEGVSVGACDNTLADWPDPGVLDTSSELVVTMDNGELAATTVSTILLNRESNVFLVGDELIQAYDVSLLAPGQYRIRGMIRGLRGTEWAIGTHGPGETFVALDLKLRNATHGIGDIGVPLFVKAVTLNKVLDDVTEESFTDTGRRLKPFSPAQLLAVPNGGDIVLTWNRRTRKQYRYGGDVPVVPLGEETELYRVQVYDGPTLVRTTDVTTPTYTYTAADAAADGFAPTDIATFVVAQVSGTIGPGYTSTIEGTIP